MPESIDWPPPHPPRPRRRRRFLLILAVLAGIVFGGRTALSYYVGVLWFGSLGYADVFWKTLSLQWGIFAAFTAATFLILYGSFLALKRAHLPDLPSGHTIYIGGQPLKLPVEPVLRLIALGVSLVIAAGGWPTQPDLTLEGAPSKLCLGGAGGPAFRRHNEAGGAPSFAFFGGWPTVLHGLFFASHIGTWVPHPCVLCKGGPRCC
jgi:hypothetical protein